MRIGITKTIGMTGVVGALLLSASPALAASTWERTVTVTGPQGNTATYTVDRTCGVRGCKSTRTVTGPEGNTGTHTTYRPARHR